MILKKKSNEYPFSFVHLSVLPKPNAMEECAFIFSILFNDINITSNLAFDLLK